jgi:hypothetical protein
MAQRGPINPRGSEATRLELRQKLPFRVFKLSYNLHSTEHDWLLEQLRVIARFYHSQRTSVS